jgi:hypothetical protein
MNETESRLPSILLAMRLWGVTDMGILRLIRLRRKYLGTRARWDGSAARLGFARWLYLSGRISG